MSVVASSSCLNLAPHIRLTFPPRRLNNFMHITLQRPIILLILTLLIKRLNITYNMRVNDSAERLVLDGEEVAEEGLDGCGFYDCAVSHKD